MRKTQPHFTTQLVAFPKSNEIPSQHQSGDSVRRATGRRQGECGKERPSVAYDVGPSTADSLLAGDTSGHDDRNNRKVFPFD